VNDLRAKNLAEAFRLEIVEGESAIGGGAAPTSRLRTALISISHANLSANDIEQALRDGTPPVISRIEADRVLLDLRTVFPEEAPELTEALLAIS
jgi:L-seryl-tRNA(Ser) seleniumtransferase